MVGMMVSPSNLSLSTKLSTSFPLAPSFSALLGPLGLGTEHSPIRAYPGPKHTQPEPRKRYLTETETEDST